MHYLNVNMLKGQKMKRRLISALMLVVCLWLGNTLKADILTLYPTDDAYVSSTEPDTVHNGNGLSAGYNASEITRSYLMFDLSAIPDGQTIMAADLRLDASFVTLPEAPEIGAYYLLDDNWSESTLTWNNAPTSLSMFPTDTQLVNIDEVFWNVLIDVSYVYNDDDMYSAVLKLPEEISGTAASFWSKDLGVIDWSPYLAIEYQPVPEPVTLVLFGLGGLILKKRKS